jgi:hypothetical protein
MSEDDHVGFLGRWSRRKLAPASRRTKEPGTVPADEAANVAANTEPFADFDFALLDFSSDYRRFMSGGVPDHVRTRALQQLWTSSDLIAQPDELDEFLEDFRDQAKALPSALARSAYRIGRGFADAEADSVVSNARDNAASEETPSGEATPDARHDDGTRGAMPDNPDGDGETGRNSQVPRQADKR